MKSWIVTAVVALAPALALGCGRHPQSTGAKAPAQTTEYHGQTEAQPTARQGAAARKTAGIALPSDAKLVASARTSDLRAFPELRRHAGMTQAQPQRGQTQAQRAEAARATDNVYVTKQSYRDAVQFFDNEAKKEGLKPLERNVTQTATGWTFKLPNGDVEDVIVRNTSPTTIETVRAHGPATLLTPR